MKRSQYTFLVLLIGGMSALNPVAIDSFLPAIPDIAKELAVDPGYLKDPGSLGVSGGDDSRSRRGRGYH